MSQYNNLLEGYFSNLCEKYNRKPAVVYKILSEERIEGFLSNFNYKNTFAGILFSKKSELDVNRLVLLYNVFCWNILYKKMLADELSEQKENNADNLEQDERKEQDKRNKRYNLQNEIMKTAFYKNLFDELVYHLVEFKNDEDVIKFLWEKTFGSLNDGNNKDEFVQMEKEILDCVKQVMKKKHPIICVANADNADAIKNQNKYDRYTFVQWKKWDTLPEFEKAHEKKSPHLKFNEVLEAFDDKIFGQETVTSIKDAEQQKVKELLSQSVDDYLDEKDGTYKIFFELIDYYLNFCSHERSFKGDSANNKLFLAKKNYLWCLISNHLKVIFRNDKRDEFMKQFNAKFIESEKIKYANEQAKAEIVNIIELSSTVQFGKVMTYGDDQYDFYNDDIYKNLLDSSQSDCLDYLEGDLLPKDLVDVIANELKYKNLCKEIIFGKETR